VYLDLMQPKWSCGLAAWWRPSHRAARGVGKAHQLLSSAIIRGDDELASWVDSVVKRNLVIGKPECLGELKKRLDTVMAPLPDAAPANASEPGAGPPSPTTIGSVA
jgi:hypothetical protein